MKPVVVPALVPVLLTVCAAAASAAVSTAATDGIFASFVAPGTPGCAVGIFENGKPRLMRGYGTADIASGKPLTEATLFYAASTSKQFTALSIVLLALDGKLHLTDDVRRYVPELPNYGTPITLSMLLHHTSGLGDYLSLFESEGIDHFETLDPAAVLAMILRKESVQFTPGTRYSYSNSGYFLLAEIVKRVSGKPFPQFVHLRILEPLDMNDTFVRNGANPSTANVAHGYVPKDQGYEIKDTYPAFGGSGGIMTSIRDLQKFDRDFQEGHRVWSTKVRKLMLAPGTFTDGKPVMTEGLMYAAGLNVGTVRGLNWVSHGGSATAFRSEYVRLPDRRLGIAVLCNRGDAKPGAFVNQIIDSLGFGPLPGAWPSD